MKTCSFFGHRNAKETVALRERLREIVIRLIEKENVRYFLFGSASKFDDLCLKTVTEIKAEYPEIKRIYVRSQYPHISERYKNYLLESYDDTFMPSGIENAGKASYVERNQAMIDQSDYCVFYYDTEYKPPLRKECKDSALSYQPKSGTKLAYEYAQEKQRKHQKPKIINIA